MWVVVFVAVAGWQQGVNLLAAVSVLITTDVCCKRIAAGNKDTSVSAALPWCDSIRQEDAYWQGENGGMDRERDRGSNQSSSQSPWHWRNVTRVHTIIPSTPREHYLNSNLYHRLNVSRRTLFNTGTGLLLQTSYKHPLIINNFETGHMTCLFFTFGFIKDLLHLMPKFLTKFIPYYSNWAQTFKTLCTVPFNSVITSQDLAPSVWAGNDCKPQTPNFSSISVKFT